MSMSPYLISNVYICLMGHGKGKLLGLFFKVHPKYNSFWEELPEIFQAQQTTLHLALLQPVSYSNNMSCVLAQ